MNKNWFIQKCDNLKKSFSLISDSSLVLLSLNIVIIILLWIADIDLICNKAQDTDYNSHIVSAICLFIIVIQVYYIYKLKKHLKEERLLRVMVSCEEDIKKEKFDVVVLITVLIQIWLVLLYLINKHWLHCIDFKFVDLLLTIVFVLMLFVQIYHVKKIKKTVYTSDSTNIKSYNSESNWSFFVILGIGLVLAYIQFSPYSAKYKETLDVVLPPLYTTCFSIVVLQIFYTRRTEKHFWAEVKEIVLQFFTDNNDNLLNRLDADRIKKIIDNCYKSLFGKELAEGIKNVTYSNQIELGCYRTNFSYEVSISKIYGEFSMAQMLQYKKIMRPYKSKRKYIVSIFDFERNPFQQTSKDEIIFFREDLRSENLIQDIKNAHKIAKNIGMWYEEKYQLIEKKEDSCDKKLLNNLYDCFLEDGGKEKSLKCAKKIIINIMNTNLELKKLIEGKKNINKKGNEIIKNFFTNETVKDSILNRKVIPDLADKIQHVIIATLLGYELFHLGVSGQLEQLECEEIKTEYVTEEGNSSHIKGIKFLSIIKDEYFRNEPDDYVSLYYLMKCDYLTENQCFFYWKFCEPIIGPKCSVHFDGIDVSKVQVVQYFADNQELVDVSPKLNRIAFNSDSTFLPESGVYMHWEH